MRVISGKARSIRLETPEGNGTRPTTDRIKETLFNMINFDLPGATFLDIFSGSGAIGIEALSRGASQATFIEKDSNALSYIKRNLKATHLENLSTVLEGDFQTRLLGLKGQQFDIIFMDPPYELGCETEVLRLIQSNELLAPEGRIIIERASTKAFKVEVDGFYVTKEKVFKTTTMTFISQEENK